MGIKSNFSLSDMMKNHEVFIQNVELVLFDCLDRTIIEITNLAKNTNTYTDRTNNLRSSIAYVLFRDGEFVKSNFSGAGSGTDGNGKAGAQTGENLAKEVGKEFTKGYVCVLVAGMDYAVYVESKGFDVISGAWMQFDTVFQANAKILKDAVGIDFKIAK